MKERDERADALEEAQQRVDALEERCKELDGKPEDADAAKGAADLAVDSVSHSDLRETDADQEPAYERLRKQEEARRKAGDMDRARVIEQMRQKEADYRREHERKRQEMQRLSAKDAIRRIEIGEEKEAARADQAARKEAEKRRIQEQMRREEQKQQKIESIRRKIVEGGGRLADGELPSGMKEVTCSRCGQKGHMRTNRSCPMATRERTQFEEFVETNPKWKATWLAPEDLLEGCAEAGSFQEAAGKRLPPSPIFTWGPGANGGARSTSTHTSTNTSTTQGPDMEMKKRTDFDPSKMANFDMALSLAAAKDASNREAIRFPGGRDADIYKLFVYAESGEPIEHDAESASQIRIRIFSILLNACRGEFSGDCTTYVCFDEHYGDLRVIKRDAVLREIDGWKNQGKGQFKVKAFYITGEDEERHTEILDVPKHHANPPKSWGAGAGAVPAGRYRVRYFCVSARTKSGDHPFSFNKSIALPLAYSGLRCIDNAIIYLEFTKVDLDYTLGGGVEEAKQTNAEGGAPPPPGDSHSGKHGSGGSGNSSSSKHADPGVDHARFEREHDERVRRAEAEAVARASEARDRNAKRKEALDAARQAAAEREAANLRSLQRRAESAAPQLLAPKKKGGRSAPVLSAGDQAIHEAWDSEAERQARRDAFELKQMQEHVARLEKEQAEREEKVRKKDAEASKRMEAAKHVVPASPSIADFIGDV